MVFDEAQRAWDREYMKFKGRSARSEPELLIAAAERIPEWSVLVGLVGEGQEIYSGEEAGMPQWRAALDPNTTRLDWTLHCPPVLEGEFQGLPVVMHQQLNLTTSLRSRRADAEADHRLSAADLAGAVCGGPRASAGSVAVAWSSSGAGASAAGSGSSVSSPVMDCTGTVGHALLLAADGGDAACSDRAAVLVAHPHGDAG